MLDDWAIRRVIDQYCRYLDDRRFAPLLELFAEDATFSTMGQALAGRVAMAAFFGPGDVVAAERPRATHVLSNCIVEVDGDTASAETDWVMIRRTGEGATIIELAGRYRDRLRRSAETWLFTERRAIAMARPPRDS
jgi:3-phenylpropionate/cinnamic acid dioxygenase small subunit